MTAPHSRTYWLESHVPTTPVATATWGVHHYDQVVLGEDYVRPNCNLWYMKSSIDRSDSLLAIVGCENVGAKVLLRAALEMGSVRFLGLEHWAPDIPTYVRISFREYFGQLFPLTERG